MEDKEKSELVEIMATTPGWKIIKEFIEEQADPERLIGATPDNFEAIRSQIVAYKNILAKVEEYINIKTEV